MSRKTLFLISVSLLLVVVLALSGMNIAAEKTINLKFAALMSPSHPHVKTHEYFAKKVEEYSGGKVKVQVYPSGQLGQTNDVLMGMQMGTIDMGKAATAFVTQIIPEVAVFDLPYIFKDRDHLYRVLNGKVGEYFMNEVFPKYGLKGVYFLEDGIRSIYADKPVRTPADMKGLKIRVMSSNIMIETINQMGGIGTPTAWGEVYTALEQHIIDGAENSPVLFEDSKHWEIKKVYSMTEQFYAVCASFISKKVWDKLPDYAKEAIEKAGKDAGVYSRQVYVETENGAMDRLRAHGVQIIQDVDRNAFRERMGPVYELFKKKHGSKLIDMIKAEE